MITLADWAQNYFKKNNSFPTPSAGASANTGYSNPFENRADQARFVTLDQNTNPMSALNASLQAVGSAHPGAITCITTGAAQSGQKFLIFGADRNNNPIRGVRTGDAWVSVDGGAIPDQPSNLIQQVILFTEPVNPVVSTITKNPLLLLAVLIATIMIGGYIASRFSRNARGNSQRLRR